MYLAYTCQISQSIDAFPYNGPGTSNGARPAGRDRIVHAFACRMSASRGKKGKEDPDISSSSDFWMTRQLKDYLRKQEAAISGRKSRLKIGLVERPRD